MQLIVSQITHEAQDVLGLELRDPSGGPLPAFTAGAHVDVHLPHGLCRQYSVANGPAERHRYVLGVGLAPDSRGGSAFIHHQLRVGQLLEVGAPRSLFGLSDAVHQHLLVAGGIGITPILSMMEACQARGQAWRLLYCVRSRARAAYAWPLGRFGSQRVTLHVDEEAGGQPPDLRSFLGQPDPGVHVYCCGPAGLMRAVEQCALGAEFQAEQIHFERFHAETTAAGAMHARQAFTAVLHRSGLRVPVPHNVSLLDALEQHGVCIPNACREGLCRSCEVGLVSGQAQHLDHVLSEPERQAQRSLLPCVSRSLGPELVLDL